MNDDMLSQEEIDALMNNQMDSDESDSSNDNDAIAEIGEEEKDVMGEVNNIAMGSAATALYTLLDQKVEITAPEVELITFEEITEQYEKPCVLVKVEYIEGLKGVNLLIIKERDAAIIADLMMGGDGTDPDEELSEMHTSAVGEAMNQMMGSASTSLSSIIDGVVNISPPAANYLEINDAVDEDGDYFAPDDVLVATSFNLKIGDLIDSNFKQLAPLEFTKQLVKELSQEGGLTAKDDNKQQEEISAVAEERSSSNQQQSEQKRQTASRSEKSQPRQPQPKQRTSNRRQRVENEEEVAVQSAQFPDFNEESAQPLPQNMELIKDVPLQVTVRLGKTKMTIRDILELGEGSIVELDQLAGEPVDLLVNGKLVAKGEVVVIDENFGFRVKDIISPMERINNIS